MSEMKEILIRSKEQQAIDVFKEFIETKGNLEIDYSLETYMQIILDCITNLQEENKIKDTNWESLKYYLEKLYYKDYIEEAISDDIDKKIKELESKVEIKGYQKDIKALQEENESLKERIIELHNKEKELLSDWHKKNNEAVDYKSRCEEAREYIKEHCEIVRFEDEGIDMIGKVEGIPLLNILEGEDKNECRKSK